MRHRDEDEDEDVGSRAKTNNGERMSSEIAKQDDAE
jgi:hypothetical protein